MGERGVFHGRCLCTAVKYEITGVEPAFQGYCHCESCRRSHSSPLVPLVCFPICLEHGFADKEGKFKVTEGADLLTSYHHTRAGPRRTFCKRCGSRVFNAGGSSLVTFPSVIAGAFSFQPEVHLHYPESVLPMKDGLPKYSEWIESEKVEEGA